MVLRGVLMSPDVYYACSLHALSIEKEEIMGLLIGKFTPDDVALISSLIVLQRSDKRKDRVEISTEQLHSAMEKTNELSNVLNEQLNIVGWYHSHPHITVLPSHVDLRTQATYQMLDPRFVGIIFSVFNEDKSKAQEIQVTCFQSVARGSGNHAQVDVPLVLESKRHISLPSLEAVHRLPQILSEEDMAIYLQSKQSSQYDILAKFHNDATLVTSQCHILKSTAIPLLSDAEHRVQECQRQCEELERERDRLMCMLSAQKTT